MVDAAAIAGSTVRGRFAAFGAKPLSPTPEDLGRYIFAENVTWQKIICKGGITLD